MVLITKKLSLHECLLILCCTSKCTQQAKYNWCCLEDSDLVETANSKTDTWSKRQNRHWVIKAEEQTDTETWTFLCWYLKVTPWLIAAMRYLAIYQDFKSFQFYANFQTPKNFIDNFLLGNCKLKTVVQFIFSLQKCISHKKDSHFQTFGAFFS